MSIVVETPDTRAPERDYILSVVLGEFLDLDWHRVALDRTDTRITLQGHSGELRLPDILLQTPDTEWLGHNSLPSQPLPVWDSSELGLPITLINKHLPVIYGDQRLEARGYRPEDNDIHTSSDSASSSLNTLNVARKTHIPLDVFGSAFFMLTRYEEIVKPDRDEHDRFPAWGSLAYQENFLERPIVDEYTEVLWAVMQNLWPGLERVERNFQILVSHDVDSPSLYAFKSWYGTARAMAGDVIKRRDLGGMIRGPWIRNRTKTHLHPADPQNTFDWLMDVSDRHGLRSAFYFICGRTDRKKDAAYEPEHPVIRELMRRIHARGHEIGLHPSYNSFRSPEVIAIEADRLRRVCAEEGIVQLGWGGRMHFLRWEQPATLQDLEDAGMLYDSTLGFADRSGFRCGTCQEYPAFDPVERRQFVLRLRPLVVMECTVMGKRYMGLGEGDAALECMKRLKRRCETVQGNFTLLWHNSQLENKRKKAMYEAVLGGGVRDNPI